MKEKNYEQLIRDGITAVKNGERNLARSLFRQAILLNGLDARPYYWLSKMAEDQQERRKYLEQAVIIDPGDAAVRRELVELSENVDRSRLVPEGSQVEPRRPSEPEEARQRVLLCVKCGGRMSFSMERGALVCEYCGNQLPLEKSPYADEAEQALDFVMPTTRAHRWAEAQQRLSCERCGAQSILPPGQTSGQCPYCGSNRLVDANESIELLDPQAIGLPKIDERDAMRRAIEWLESNPLTPDDLKQSMQNLQLRPAYYPFWTFDGILEVPWWCEVKVGGQRNGHWERRSGTEFELFDDVLVPGLKAFSVEELAELEPFSLKELAAFNPEFLSGWLSLTYDRPLAEASLLAREKVLKKVRGERFKRIEPGQEKRYISIGTGKWSGQTYKYILLPAYRGTYQYRGVDYRILVNGQTGGVGGDRPRDPVKVGLIGLGVALVVVILAVLLLLILLNYPAS